MAITFNCPHCKKKLKAPDSAAGKTSPCPYCGGLAACPELVYEAEVVLVSPGKSPAPQPPPARPAAKIVSPPREVPVARIVSQPPAAVPVAKLVSTVDEPRIELDDDDGRPYALVNPPQAAAAESPVESRRPCSSCGERILASAAICRFCGEVFDPALKKGKVKKPKKSFSKNSYSRTSGAEGRDLIVGFICFVIGSGLTLASYANAASKPGGGSYLVWYGLIIGGLAGMFRGITALARSGR
jgi:hypothetical protein